MATRREVQQRCRELRTALRAATRNGTLAPGQLAPPFRELAERYQLSVNVVRQALRELLDEGVLYTVPRVGTFVGRPSHLAHEFYLLLFGRSPGPGEYYTQIQVGFEERIAQLGGASLVMTLEAALDCRRREELPALAGLFDFAYRPHEGRSWGVEDGVHRVYFASWAEEKRRSDLVSFDDVDGGRQAAQHLLGLGHRRIAYLGLHDGAGAPGLFIWSAEREEGWRQALTAAGYPTEGLAYHPPAVSHAGPEDQVRIACDAAHALVHRMDVTAVVAANDFAATGLLEALRAGGVPLREWPAIVGFDNRPGINGHVLTSLRLPWEEIGRTAAELLWERRNGRLVGAPQHRRVPMRLIPRLTSRADWSVMAGHAALAAPEP